MSETDSDGIPELVSSDSEEENAELPEKSNYEIATNWLSKSPRFLEMQDRDIRIFCFGPFMFVITDVLSSSWIKALKTMGLILNEKRGKELLGFDWSEWALLDLMDAALDEVQIFLRDKGNLVKLLDVLDRIEAGNRIDLDLGLKLIANLPELETNFFRKPVCDGKEKQARFAVLYIGRIYKKHVVGLYKESKDLAVEMKKSLRSSLSIETAERNKDLGNLEFHKGKYEKAVDYYSRAAMADCLNHIYFGNRAQAFTKLHRYSDGLADGRRCIVLKPDWFKGHYRYAQAFFDLNKLDLALEANIKGLTLCRKSKGVSDNLGDLVEQGNRFRKEKEDRNIHEVADKIREKSGEIEGKKIITLNFSNDVPELVSDSDSETELNIPVDHKRRGSKEKNKTEAVNKKPSQLNNRKEQKEVPPVKETSTNAFTIASTVKPPSPSPEPKPEPTPEPTPVPPTKTLSYKEEVHQYMVEGSNLFLGEVGKSALYSYQKALDLISHSKYETIGIDEEDHVVLKYAYGMAAITTGLYKPILDGLETFSDITESHIGIKFPLAYFGLGKAYIALNRYRQALAPIRKGLVIASNLKLVPLVWPGTSMKIDQSTNKILKETLKRMYMLAKYPPAFDALCRFHSDDDDSRKEIYFTDPNFKGFIRITCDDHCVIEFHHHCWKAYKSSYGEKTNDKDILDSSCPTPDCMAVILKIVIFRQDTLPQKEIISDKPRAKIIKRRPKRKMKLSSPHKIAHREERKQMRKQKRRELDDLVDDVDEMIDSVKNDGVIAEEILPTTVHANSPNVFILRKDEDDPAEKYKGIKQKQPKPKKKKEKVKQLLILEVNFTDEKEKYLLNESYVDDENQQTRAPVGSIVELNPFTVPPALQDSVTQFESSYTSKPFTSAHDDITENLLSFFEDLLQATGPITIEDPKITQELEVFPQEAKDTIQNAGGLGNFLSQSLKFAMFENIVCLLKDANKAKQFAEFSKERSRSVDDIENSLKEVNTIYSKKGEVPELAELPSLNPHASEFHPIDNSWQVVSHSKHFQKSKMDKDFKFPNIPKTRFTSDNISYPIDSSKEKDFDEESSEITDFSANSVIHDGIGIGEGVGGVTEEVRHDLPHQFSFIPESKMDTLDSIDDVPLVTVRKITKISNQLCNYQTSETDSESVQEGSNQSDRESLCSQDDYKTSMITRKKKIVIDPAIEDPGNSRSSSRSDISVSDQSELSGIWSSQPKSLSLKKGSIRDLWVSSPKGDSGLSDHEWEKSSPSFSENLLGSSKMDEFSSNALTVTTGSLFFSGNSQLISSVSSLASPVYSSPILETQFTKFDPFKGTAKKMNDETNQSWNDYRSPYDTDNLGNNDSLNDLRTPSSIWSTNSRVGVSDHFQGKNKSAEDFMRQHYKSDNHTTWSSSDDALIDKITPHSVHNFIPLPSPAPLNPLSISKPPPHMSLGLNYPNPAAVSSSTSFVSDLHSQPINAYTNTQVKKTNKMDQSVQCCMEMNTVGVNTDPYEPLREDYCRLEKEHDILILNLETATAKAHKMTDMSKTLDVKNKRLEEDLHRILAEKSKWEQDKSALFGEIQQTRQMLANKAAVEKELQSALDEVEKQRRQSLNEREKILDEKKQILDSAEEYRRQYKMEADRAKHAEIEILKTQLLQGKQNLERYQKDANQHIRHLTGFAKKHQEGQVAVPLQIQQALEYYNMVIQKCEDQFSSLSQEIDGQIQHVLNGGNLSDLPAIQFPSIPQPPENMKALVSIPLPLSPVMFGPGSKTIKSGRASSPPAAITSLPDPNWTNNIASSDASDKHYPSSTTETPHQQIPQKPRPPPMLGMMTIPLLTRPPVFGNLANRPPLRAPFQAAQRTIPPVLTNAPKNSFEKLIMSLQTTFPNQERMYYTKLIMDLRHRCGGSLSGMTLDEITEQIKKSIEQQQQNSSNLQEKTDTETEIRQPLAPPPGLNNSWGFPKQVTSSSNTKAEVFQEEKDPCVICHDEMENRDTTILVCGHQFHNECIRKWLKGQSTCPNCRIHALLPDDFPILK